MALITVVKSPFHDAMHTLDMQSLDDVYPDGHLVHEVEDCSYWGRDPALKYEYGEDENPLAS